MTETANGPTISQISLAASEFLPNKVETIKSLNSGSNSSAFEISTRSGNFIVRISEENQNYDVEHELLRIARENGVMVPRPIAANIDLDVFPFTFSILEKIPGAPLQSVDKKYWPSILEEVG